LAAERAGLLSLTFPQIPELVAALLPELGVQHAHAAVLIQLHAAEHLHPEGDPADLSRHRDGHEPAANVGLGEGWTAAARQDEPAVGTEGYGRNHLRDLAENLFRHLNGADE
jgi:hypothetical protein